GWGEGDWEGEGGGELVREPLQPGHALRPDHSLGSLLELARDQRRTPEEADEQRQHHQEGDELAQGREAALKASLQVAAVVAASAEAVREARVVKDGAHVQAGKAEEEREQRERRGAEQGLLAVLAVDQPAHARASA